MPTLSARIDLICAETPNARHSESYESIFEAILAAKRLEKGLVRITIEEDNQLYDFYLKAKEYK